MKKYGQNFVISSWQTMAIEILTISETYAELMWKKVCYFVLLWTLFGTEWLAFNFFSRSLTLNSEKIQQHSTYIAFVSVQTMFLPGSMLLSNQILRVHHFNFGLNVQTANRRCFTFMHTARNYFGHHVNWKCASR